MKNVDSINSLEGVDEIDLEKQLTEYALLVSLIVSENNLNLDKCLNDMGLDANTWFGCMRMEFAADLDLDELNASFEGFLRPIYDEVLMSVESDVKIAQSLIEGSDMEGSSLAGVLDKFMDSEKKSVMSRGGYNNLREFHKDLKENVLPNLKKRKESVVFLQEECGYEILDVLDNEFVDRYDSLLLETDENAGKASELIGELGLSICDDFPGLYKYINSEKKKNYSDDMFEKLGVFNEFLKNELLPSLEKKIELMGKEVVVTGEIEEVQEIEEEVDNTIPNSENEQIVEPSEVEKKEVKSSVLSNLFFHFSRWKTRVVAVGLMLASFFAFNRDGYHEVNLDVPVKAKKNGDGSKEVLKKTSIENKFSSRFSNYLEYLESKDEWTLEEAERVGFVVNGKPKVGFEFVEAASKSKGRQNFKVKHLISDELLGKKNWSQEDFVKSGCCDVENKKFYIGYFYDRSEKNIKPVTGEYLKSKKVWDKVDAKLSGLIDKNGEPLKGFKFVSGVKKGEKRVNWKIVRIHLKNANSLESETGLDKIESQFVDLWDSYKKEEVSFKYFDITNNFKYIGEAKYNGKRNLKKIQKVHDDFRKGKGDRVMKFKEMHSIVPFNSMFKYDAVGNQYLNIKSPGDVHKVYLDKYSKDMKVGFDAFKSDLSNVSKMADLMDGDDDQYFYDMIVAQIAQESSFDTDARSKAGADGIAQITEPAITDIHNMIMSSSFRKVNFAKHRSKEGSKEMIRMLTFYDLLLKRVGSNNPKEFNEMLKDKRLFKEVIFPILVTGYNQGHLNARSMFDFLIDNHNSKKLDISYYVDGKRSLKNLNSDVILYVLTRSYDVARSTSKDLGKLDKDTMRHQSVLVRNHFGEDGVSYYVKISAIKTYFEKFKDKELSVVKSDVGKIVELGSKYNKPLVLDVKDVKSLSYYKARSAEAFLKSTKLYVGQKLYTKRNFEKFFDSISWHFYEDVDEIKSNFGDDYKYIRFGRELNNPSNRGKSSISLDEKLFGKRKVAGGIYELEDYSRMLILKENLNVYIKIAKEVHEATGKYLEINSTFRDKYAQNKFGKVDKTFHKTGKAIDLREGTFNRIERKKVEAILAKYAANGYLTFRTHGGHYHLVLHGERYREALKKYFAESDLTNAKKELKVEVARIDKTSKKK